MNAPPWGHCVGLPGLAPATRDPGDVSSSAWTSRHEGSGFATHFETSPQMAWGTGVGSAGRRQPRGLLLTRLDRPSLDEICMYDDDCEEYGLCSQWQAPRRVGGAGAAGEERMAIRQMRARTITRTQGDRVDGLHLGEAGLGSHGSDCFWSDSAFEGNSVFPHVAAASQGLHRSTGGDDVDGSGDEPSAIWEGLRTPSDWPALSPCESPRWPTSVWQQNRIEGISASDSFFWTPNTSESVPGQLPVATGGIGSTAIFPDTASVDDATSQGPAGVWYHQNLATNRQRCDSLRNRISQGEMDLANMQRQHEDERRQLEQRIAQLRATMMVYSIPLEELYDPAVDRDAHQPTVCTAPSNTSDVVVAPHAPSESSYDWQAGRDSLKLKLARLSSLLGKRTRRRASAA